MLISLVPFTFLIILNSLLYYNIRNRQRVMNKRNNNNRRHSQGSDSGHLQRDLFVATILILIVVFYAVCNSLRYEEWINNKKNIFLKFLDVFSTLSS